MKTIKTRAAVAVIGLALLGVSACGGSDSSGKPAEDDLGLARDGEVSVGFMNGLMPYVGLEKGKLTGVDGDLFLKAAAPLDLKIKPQGLEFSAMIAGVQSGRYDIGIGGIAWTEEREKQGVFTDPVYYSPALLLSRPGVTVKTIADLDGLSIGAVTGSLNDDATRATPGVKAQTYPAWAQAIADLEAGRLDAINIDPLTAVYLRDTRKDLADYETSVIDPPTEAELAKSPGLQGYNPYQVVWYCSPKAKNLCAKLTDQINDMYADGSSKEILTEWGVDATSFLTSTPDATTLRVGKDRDDTWVAPTVGG